MLALQRNDLRAAKANLETAAKLAPQNAKIWVGLAQTYSKLRDNVKAEAAASKATEFGAADPLVVNALGIYYFEAARDLLAQEKFAEAVSLLRGARVPKNGQLELTLGVAYYGLRRFDDAAGSFLNTIALSREVEQPYLFLGKMLDVIPSRLPEVTKRFVEFEKAHPSNYLGYLLHAKALDVQGVEPEIAERLLLKSLSLNDRDASAHFELGTLLERQQRYADAAAAFERATALDSRDPATHYRLSRVYDRLGKHEAARAERAEHARLIR